MSSRFSLDPLSRLHHWSERCIGSSECSWMSRSAALGWRRELLPGSLGWVKSRPTMPNSDPHRRAGNTLKAMTWSAGTSRGCAVHSSAFACANGEHTAPTRVKWGSECLSPSLPHRDRFGLIPAARRARLASSAGISVSPARVSPRSTPRRGSPWWGAKNQWARLPKPPSRSRSRSGSTELTAKSRHRIARATSTGPPFPPRTSTQRPFIAPP